MIRTTRQQFDRLLRLVTEPPPPGTPPPSAHRIERRLLTGVLELARLLLGLFFAVAAERLVAQQSQRPHSFKKRALLTLFGRVTLERPYYHQAPTRTERLPLDAQLNLPTDGYSDPLREAMDRVSVQQAFGEGARLLEELFGLSLSGSVLQRTLQSDAEAVEAFYEQQAPPAPEQEAPVLVAQADGKGVPMRNRTAARGARLGKGQKRTRKKEALVTSLYSAWPRVRSADTVMNSFFKTEEDELQKAACEASSAPKRPQHKKVWATLQGKQTAFDRLTAQVRRRDGPHMAHRVALCDGCQALQEHFERRFPDFVLVLDFVHASEYLWKAANRLFEETDLQREAWVRQQAQRLLEGELDAVLEVLEQANDPDCRKVARYFRRNRERMDYERYLRQGWPIASGQIEGACRHLVKDRCECAGMRWSEEGAEQVLRLRAVSCNGDWEAYHQWRRQWRYRHVYEDAAVDHAPSKSPLAQAA